MLKPLKDVQATNKKTSNIHEHACMIEIYITIQALNLSSIPTV